MKAVVRLVAALMLTGISASAQARISPENRAAAEAFQAAVRGERPFGTDFMVDPPTGDEQAYLMNLGSCRAGDLRERGGNSVEMPWSCNMDGQRFQKYVVLQLAGGKIAKVGVFDCFNMEGRRRCS